MYDIVKNPIPRSSLFVTESLEDVFKRIDGFSNRQERAQAYQIAMLVCNACHKAVEDEILSKEVFAQ
jgi:hypothetical protein